MTGTILSINDRTPSLAPTAWVAPTATVIGDASIGHSSGIFYGAVLRADMEVIIVGAGSNVQDNAVVHADPGFPALIGDGVSIGHGAVLHGCIVGNGVLIGMNATVLNGANIGEGSLVAANALVLENTVVPPRSLVAGIPAKVRRELTETEVEHCRANATNYESLAIQHREATAAASVAFSPKNRVPTTA